MVKNLEDQGADRNTGSEDGSHAVRDGNKDHIVSLTRTFMVHCKEMFYL